SDDISVADAEVMQYRHRIVAREFITVIGIGLRHVRRRIAARVIGDAAIAAGKIPDLAFPFAIIGAVFVNEQDGKAGAGLLVVQPNLARLRVRHFSAPPERAAASPPPLASLAASLSRGGRINSTPPVQASSPRGRNCPSGHGPSPRLCRS